MSSYVVTFRSPATAPTQEQEQAWGGLVRPDRCARH